MAKIVVLDGWTLNPGDLSWAALGALGEVKIYERTANKDRIKCIGDADVVFTNKVGMSADIFDACPKVRFICVLATGYNIIDMKAATAHQVTVSNIPSYGTDAVGQFAIALLLEICHHIGHHDRTVHEGKWAASADWCYWDYPLIELAGKTMGIIGFGRIGQCTGRIAKAFGMKVLAYDSFKNLAMEDESCHYTTLDELLSGSDVIALHCPLLPETEGIINKANIAKMKDGVIIINNSRGPLVVEQDLADALNSRKVYAAGLDVTSSEPIQPDNPLIRAKNCIITPHISWAPKESRQRLMDIAVENLRQFLAGTPVNVVR